MHMKLIVVLRLMMGCYMLDWMRLGGPLGLVFGASDLEICIYHLGLQNDTICSSYYLYLSPNRHGI